MGDTDQNNVAVTARIEFSLDAISRRLGQIEDQLKDIARLQERVNNHDKTLARYGDKLDRQDERIHEGELWRAHHGDKTRFEQLLVDVREELKSLSKRIDTIEDDNAKNEGKKDVAKDIFKWATGILSAVVIFMLTGK